MDNTSGQNIAISRGFNWAGSLIAVKTLSCTGNESNVGECNMVFGHVIATEPCMSAGVICNVTDIGVRLLAGDIFEGLTMYLIKCWWLHGISLL